MLEGIRVLDLAQNIAGPQATQILGDLGADVIKVEPPEGDPTRQWGPPFWDNEAPLYLAFNRNKRSIVLDLKSEMDLEVLQRLIASADIFVQAFRTGAIERFGLSYKDLHKKYPKLIYASISGYGSSGPLAETPGYDPLLQAYSGIMSITGYHDGPPARVGAAIVDIGTGLLAALGILAALRKRDAEGFGTHVETALLDTSLSWISYHMMGYLADGKIPQRMGTGLRMVAPYEAFPTTDGELMICSGNDGIFSRLCEALEIPEIAKDLRFCDNPSRVNNHAELCKVLAQRTKQYTTQVLHELLHKHRIPNSPIHDISQVVDNPQVRANEIFEPQPHPRIPDYRDLKLPLKFDGNRSITKNVPPELGEHTNEILTELGFVQRA